MIEEDFYATLKFKSGEEIFAKVAASEEEDRTILLVSNPIIDRKSTRLNSSHSQQSRMPSSA